MDPLAKDFFLNTFPGITTGIDIQDDILTTEAPVVELPLDVDVQTLLQLVKDIPTDPTKRKLYPYENWPRIQGWHHKMLWSDGTVCPIMDDVYYKKQCAPVPLIEPNGVEQLVKEQINKLGINPNMCMLSVLHPDGYIRPHRDINLLDKHLGYFWLPLNNPPGNELKIYPYGTVDVTLGNLYLLNQNSFTHAVVNNSSEMRYVIVGWFDQVSAELDQLIRTSIAAQYNQNI